jgi:hypothetical protein
MNILNFQIGLGGKDLMSKRLNIEFIRAEFAKEGYVLLTEVYKNNIQKLDYICPKGHRHSITWNNWRGGKRCFYCRGTIKLDIEFIRSEFAKEGYTLLITVYEGNKQKLDYICPKGHKHKISWQGWQGGNRCPFCVGLGKLTIEYIRSEFVKEGYELLTKVYKNAFQKLEYICPKGHLHSITWNSWQRGRRCPICPSKVSRWEFEVKKYVKSLNVSFLSNSRNTLINPNTNHSLELDMWFPDLNKAIECNGSYWHSIEKASKRDKIKSMLCKQKNIDLLVLDDIEWAEDKPFCKHKIRNFITTKEAK